MGTLRAQETRRVSIGCVVGLDVQVVAVWRSRAKRSEDHFKMSHILSL